MNDDHKMIPVKEGLWSKPASPHEHPHLLAHTCSRCGEVFFPKQESGICTYCHSSDLAEIALSPRGRVYTCTVVTLRPPGGYYRGEVPYAIGFVELPEGVRVETLFTGCDPEEITVGMEVEITVEKLHDDDDGNAVMTYKFRPTTA